jgi:hypothetical protein
LAERPDHGDLDPAELAAADELDRQIDAVLAGRAGRDATPELTWLSAAVRTDPPPRIAATVADRRARVLRIRWRPVRWAAAAMAYLYLSHGIGNIVVGDWVARGVGEHHSPHLMLEGGAAFVAVGIAVLAGALRPKLLPVSVVAGVPLALVLGYNGFGEIGEFAAGAALHLSQGAVGIVLAVMFWRTWRDTRGQIGE